MLQLLRGLWGVYRGGSKTDADLMGHGPWPGAHFGPIYRYIGSIRSMRSQKSGRIRIGSKQILYRNRVG